MTPKQRLFVEEYLIDLNATQAAIRAGYSAKNADKIGSELLGKTRVAAAVMARMKVRSERLAIDADRVLQEIAKFAFAPLDTSEAAEVKVSEKLSALKLLGEHLGLFVQRRINYTKAIDQMNEDELIALLGGETDLIKLKEIEARRRKPH